MTTDQMSSMHTFIIQYMRNDRVIEIIGIGKTAEAASFRYLKQLQSSGVDVTGLTFVGGRQLKRVGRAR